MLRLWKPPKQRNTHEENKQIKSGNGGSLWNDKPHKKSHKDTDARYTKKRGETHYGYKAHVKADKKTKLIEKRMPPLTQVYMTPMLSDLL